MARQRRPYSREDSDTRRNDLIEATLRLISSKGIRAATARAIAAEAGVSQGLIRHYFTSKDDLLIATYEEHMMGLIRESIKAASGDFPTAKERLVGFIRASLTPPVASPKGVALWAGFFQMLMHDEAMRKSHVRTYTFLRRHIEDLITDVYAEEGKSVSSDKRRQLSISCNGVLDGLWIEGSAIGDTFEEGELVSAGVNAVSGILQIPLEDN
jgi:AcrR family transcriptional regulator